ncbi:MAG: nucleotide exchange factor GrpE, partial [Gemmatimonadota bacterium]
GLAQAELLRQILPTLDDLARVADTPHESTTVQALDEGIELILRNFRKQLADAGLARIEALDQRFNPERHQAVMTTETDDPELDETISRVLVEGYEFQDRLVRPAQVEVRRYEESAEEDEE